MTSVCRKPNLSNVYNHFESSVFAICKYCIASSICSHYKDIFRRKGHPSFIANCVTCLLHKLYCWHKLNYWHQLTTVDKKPLMLVLPSYNKVLKRTLIYCKLQNVFKSQTEQGNQLKFKECALHLTSFYLERFINTRMEDVTVLNTVRQVDTWHISILQWILRKIKQANPSRNLLVLS